MKSKKKEIKPTIATKNEPQKEWEIIFYTTEQGKCPVKDFMLTLSKPDFVDMTKRIEYLQTVGNDIRRPHGAPLRDKIYELRIPILNNETRILYFFCYNDYIVLTNSFIKKTDKVPENEIEKAIKYRVVLYKVCYLLNSSPVDIIERQFECFYMIY